MWEFMWEFLTAREPGCGYFGGFEGALRFLALAAILAIIGIIALIFA